MTEVSKDPEFDALAGVVKLHGLPPKSETGTAATRKQGG